MEASVVLFFLVHLLQLVAGEVRECSGCDPINAGIWARRQMVDQFSRKFKDPEDECEHRRAFEKNLAVIDKFNKDARRNQGIFTWTIGQNGMSDKTASEFKALLGPRRQSNGTSASKTFFLVWVSTECSVEKVIVDYTVDGYVTPVMDQFSCAGCWAFSATGAMEAQLAMNEYGLPILSAQQILDCSNETLYETYGCDGGTVRGAFQFVAASSGIVTSDVYPYTGNTGPCSPPKGAKRYTCKDHIVIEKDETALLKALVRFGPIACGMHGTLPTFRLYTGGVYSDRECSNDQDHAVLVVGAGTTKDGIDYWLIKNSFGTEWGEYGYGRLLRGVNLCNIIGDCSVPCFCQPV